jgi:hypothetical protein
MPGLLKTSERGTPVYTVEDGAVLFDSDLSAVVDYEPTEETVWEPVVEEEKATLLEKVTGELSSLQNRVQYLSSILEGAQKGGARRSRKSSSKKGSKSSSSKSSKKATSHRVKVGGAERVVYEGARGGQYVKMNGGFVSLKDLKK